MAHQGSVERVQLPSLPAPRRKTHLPIRMRGGPPKLFLPTLSSGPRPKGADAHRPTGRRPRKGNMGNRVVLVQIQSGVLRWRKNRFVTALLPRQGKYVSEDYD